jgi:hypothetical protein
VVRGIAGSDHATRSIMLRDNELLRAKPATRSSALPIFDTLERGRSVLVRVLGTLKHVASDGRQMEQFSGRSTFSQSSAPEG